MSVSISRQPTEDETHEGLWEDVLQNFGLRHSNEADDNQVRVLVQPATGKYIQGETPLPEFDHPEHARYIFGPDNGHLESADYFVSVHIPTPGHGSTLWSHQAAAIVLYDRMVKRGDPG